MKKTIAKAIAVVVILGVFAGYIYSQYKQMIAPIELSKPIELRIPTGSSAVRISELLEEKGLIHNAYVFRYYVKQAGATSKLQAGNYTFSGTVSLESLCKQLQTGKIEAESVRVTIPEGKKVSETIKILVDAGLGDYDAYMDYCNNGDFKYKWIPDPKAVKEPANRLEGFLFPDTYRMSTDWSEEYIIDMLLAEFDKKWTEQYQKAADDLNYSVYEIITIASLIEREVKLNDERPMVASVIYNRFAANMKLEFCSSIQFLFEEQHPVVLLSDLEIENPYNTYKYAGLPPGPIAAPGIAAIEAALYPADTDYLYFRTKDDGSGGHFFSKSYDEHLNAGKK